MTAPAPEHVVKTLYWEAHDATETWVELTPQATGTGKDLPVRLVFSTVARGKTPKETPTEVTVLALPSALAWLPANNYTLRMSAGTTSIDMVADGRASRRLSGVGECCDTALVGAVEVGSLRQLVSEATSVQCDVLGLACVLDAADTRALQRLLEALAS